MSNNVFVKSGRVTNIITDVSSTSTGSWMFKDAPNATIQATVTGTGAVTATIVFEVSNDGVNAVATPLGTVTLSGTTAASDGFTTNAPWKYIRARVTAISGTNALITCLLGV